jgi:hypothetical protein
MKFGPKIKDRCIPASLIRKLWQDPGLTRPQAARIAGLTVANLWRRAKKLGLPPRGEGGRPVSVSQEDIPLFRTMWRAGVSAADMAGHFGISRDTPLKMAVRLGEAPRGRARRPISLSQFLEAELARHLAIEAATTRAALRDAEMVDSPRAFLRLTKVAA